MAEYFFALIPEKRLYDKILEAKSWVMRRYGRQTYLSDLPHLTLYVFSATRAPKPGELGADRMKKIRATISGWQLFLADRVTAKSTIGFAVEKRPALENAQLKCVRSAKGIISGSPARYNHIQFSEIEKKNMEDYGYPYVGKNWIAHLSLCSLDSGHVQDIKKGIDIRNIMGDYCLDRLCLFRLVEDSPVLLWEARLG
jgi:hypothetical protein